MKTRFKNNIVIIGQQPWDTEIGSNCRNIALELSKENQVLYINSPLDRITLVRSKNDPKITRRLNVIKKRENGLVKVHDNLWNYFPDCLLESINWINNDFLFNLANKYNNYRFSKSIKKALIELGFDKFMLFNDNELFKGFYLKEFLKPTLSIYYSRDYIVAVDYWKKHGKHLEPQLISKNDLCVANSVYLKEYCKRYNPNSYYVGQGCDLGLFFEKIEKTVPADLIGIKTPLIGYVGALQSLRLDIDIISHIASSRPDWSIILVGPEDEEFQASNLHKFDNVIFTGIKPISELSDYINAFDVCINPQLINEVTIGNYPRKIDEYLAVGKPIVATQTETMDIFSEFVYLAKNKEDYVTLIEKALLEDSEVLHKNRRNFALEHTWEKSVAEIYNAIHLTEQLTKS
ncbi:MAG: glycosyl transferase family 1 [Mucilaginibacter sp.]|jgi:glycosyltransferase involved in cell wall biosynthesis|nr:glycosyl transferase family 1 [Mucilaginibacter sp.]